MSCQLDGKGERGSKQLGQAGDEGGGREGLLLTQWRAQEAWGWGGGLFPQSWPLKSGSERKTQEEECEVAETEFTSQQSSCSPGAGQILDSGREAPGADGAKVEEDLAAPDQPQGEINPIIQRDAGPSPTEAHHRTGAAWLGPPPKHPAPTHKGAVKHPCT